MTNSKRTVKLIAVSVIVFAIVCLLAVTSQAVITDKTPALAANITSTGVKFTAMEGYCSGDGGQGYARLIDGVKTTDSSAKWCTNMETTPYIIFQAEVPIMVQSYVLVTGHDTASHEDRNPISWTLEGAIDYAGTETVWTTITSETNNKTLGKKSNEAYSFSINAGNSNSEDVEKIKKTYFKYFRFIVEERYGDGNGNNTKSGDMQLNELELVYTASQPALTTFTAISGTQAKDSEGYAKLVDGDVTTKWCMSTDNSPSIVIKASERIKLSGVIFTTGNDNKSNNGRNPKDWVIYGSNDNNSWTEIKRVTGDTTTMEEKNYTPYYFAIDTSSLSGTKYFQYYKLEITAVKNKTTMQLSELMFDYTARPKERSFTAIAGSGTGDEGYNKAFDGIASDKNKWCVGLINGSGSNVYVVANAYQQVIVTGYVFTTGNDTADYSGRNPKDWVLYGCNDYDVSTNTGTWNTIHTVKDDTTMGATNYTPYMFTVGGNSTAYQYYKFDFTENQNVNNVANNNNIQLGEIEFVYTTVASTFTAIDGSGSVSNESYANLTDGKKAVAMLM